jgi:hypothetical protein
MPVRLRLCLLFAAVSALVAGCCAPSINQLAAPAVLTLTPVAASNAACPSATITANFSEAMNPATLNATSFTLTTGGAPVAGQVTLSTGGTLATFTPEANLLAGASYTATVSTAARDMYGNALAAPAVSTFSIAANGCHPAPQLLSLTPLAGATGVCPNAAVVATFNEPMNVATVTAADFTLAPGVIGTVTHDATNSIFTLTPSSALASGTLYTATLGTAIQDTYGNSLPAALTTSFTTAANGCHPAPVVIAETPTTGGAASCPNSVLTIAFNEAMNPLTLNTSTFTLASGAGPITGQVSYNAAADTAIFAPLAPLALSSTYTATVSTGAQDTYGNPLATPAVWHLTTGTNTCLPPAPPAATTPANGATGICNSSVIAAVFPQAMNPATFTATSFTVTGPGNTAVAGAITADALHKTFTFTPTAALALSTVYTATLTTAVQDTFGNALATPYTWSFTTGAASCTPTPPAVPPVVAITTPLAAATGVCSNTVLTATFSTPMDPTTINTNTFTVSGGVTGTVTLDATGEIAIFTPSTTLGLNTVYTATITTGAKNLAGTALAANFPFSFTTAAHTCQLPVPLGTDALFEVLAGSTVTNAGPTVITGGDLGLSPGSAVTGFPPGTLTLPAVEHVTDAVAAQAQLDLTVAYNNAAGRTGASALPANLAGLTLTAGLYNTATAVTLSGGNLTLDAQGNPNAVFVFQIGSGLTTLSGTQVILTGGAQARNITWQVGSSATLGTFSVFEGTILSQQSITLASGATLNGRALTSVGAVTLDSNPVTAP